MKRILIAAVTVLAFAVAIPALAGANLISVEEIGLGRAGTPEPKPMCPGTPCEVLTRSTGFQTQINSTNNFQIRHPGRIAAWSITLAKPTERQVSIFRDSGEESGIKKLGLGPSEGGIEVLEFIKRPKGSKLHYAEKLVSASPIVRLGGYFGKTATFVLENTLAVKPGQIVALTVPTWAPALACQSTVLKHEGNQSFQACSGAGSWSWRSSRSAKQCSQYLASLNQVGIGSVQHYECQYRGARLMYSVSEIHP